MARFFVHFIKRFYELEVFERESLFTRLNGWMTHKAILHKQKPNVWMTHRGILHKQKHNVWMTHRGIPRKQKHSGWMTHRGIPRKQKPNVWMTHRGIPRKQKHNSKKVLLLVYKKVVFTVLSTHFY